MMADSWPTKRLKYALSFAGRGDAPAYVDAGGIPVVSQACVFQDGIRWNNAKFHDPAQISANMAWIKRDEILVNSTGTGTLGRVAFVDRTPGEPTIFDGHVTALRTIQGELLPKFLFYWLSNRQDEITALASDGATNQIELNRSRLGGFRISLPSLSVQSEIVGFLDKKTAKIDALIADKERLLKLLDERRQALITQAVTRGLDPTVPMKPSGIPWLESIPSSWQVTRLANLFSEVSIEGSEELPILSVSIHHGVSDTELGEDEVDRKVLRSEDRSKYKRVAPGDLVYNMMRAWQGGFGAVTVEGMVSPAYVVARPTTEVNTRYIELLLRTPMATQEIRRRSHGIIDFRLRLYWDEFKNILVPLPSPDQQRLILDEVRSRCAMIDDHAEITRRSMDLVHARRAALIQEAVTGLLSIEGVA